MEDAMYPWNKEALSKHAYRSYNSVYLVRRWSTSALGRIASPVTCSSSSSGLLNNDPLA